MTEYRYSLFDTAIGRCGLAWSERGIAAIQLPEARTTETRVRLLRYFPAAQKSAPPPAVQTAIDGIGALLRGEACDLSAAVLDMARVPPFHRRVYAAARAIPAGTTISYGELADRLDAPGAARVVGQALGRNPFALIVPCHRVLAARGAVGGFSAHGGIVTKLRLLALEGAAAGQSAGLFESRGELGFDAAAAVAHLRAADPALAGVIDAVGPFRLRLQTAASIFAALAEAIVYQQLTGKAAATIHARLCALFARPQEGPTAVRLLRLPEEFLRAAGLSRAKILSLRDLAQHALRGEIPTLAEINKMDDESIIERLTAVRGIGRWTVEMLLIFRLGRPDVLPLDDYGVRKGYAIAFGITGLPTRSELAQRGARWAPYRTVASWYLWRATEAKKTG